MKPCFSATGAAALALCCSLGIGFAPGEEAGGARPSIVDPAALAVPEGQSRAWAEELLRLLTCQFDLLSGVKDSSSAQAALEPLRSCLSELQSMKERVNEQALWIYIENTPDVKQPFIEVLLRTSGEFLRLGTEQFYGCQALQEALRPQMEKPSPGEPPQGN